MNDPQTRLRRIKRGPMMTLMAGPGTSLASAGLRVALCLLPFLLLWGVAINHLRVEWELNPQYSYGLLMPFLCLGLLMRRWSAVSGRGFQIPGGRWRSEAVFRVLVGMVPLAGLYLPARLIQESTPEWRMVSWAFGILAVGITLSGVYLAGGGAAVRNSAFPLLFFLVAIPWPSFIEGRLIQGLTRANTAAVIEVLTVLGIPAIQHGSVIEVGTGTLGVEEACSGIRSFQSSFMVSLFLGEYLRLGRGHRILLVPVALVVAFGLNICRTTLLTYVGATRGTDAIAAYHDPAGLAILLVCSAVVWVVAWFMHRSGPRVLGTAGSSVGLARAVPLGAQTVDSVRGHRAGTLATDSAPSGSDSAVGEMPVALGTSVRSAEERTSKESSDFAGRALSGRSTPLFRFSLGLLCWLVVVEVGVGWWYHNRESRLVLGPAWSVAFPKDNGTYQEIPMHAKTASLLRFDEGQQGSWVEADGTRWMGFYFDWRPGRVAGYLAKRHTPEVCLPASGATLREGPELMPLTVHGVVLPMRHYVFDSRDGPLQVFQCRWEAGADQGALVRHDSEALNLVRGIWVGRGKHGQKVLEFILLGSRDANQAKTALVGALGTMIRVEH